MEDDGSGTIMTNVPLVKTFEKFSVDDRLENEPRAWRWVCDGR
jgi:hypothetical protein